ncbi:UNVERIFIED_CONTAM: hypothetical protein Sradi_3739600 [Sesamum radiatum]|uniref:Uncharacterized protein n=1 Tax=Sesamum radiatum TaxID=300843 RepID=A0AAW2PYF8_SESRA
MICHWISLRGCGRKKEEESARRIVKVDDDEENGFDMVYRKKNKKLSGGSDSLVGEKLNRDASYCGPTVLGFEILTLMLTRILVQAVVRYSVQNAAVFEDSAAHLKERRLEMEFKNPFKKSVRRRKIC